MTLVLGPTYSRGSVMIETLILCRFSRRLPIAEQNYSTGDRELLAVKVALDQWGHWLEGTTPLLMIWTDHKNLEYIKSARMLNPCQARWDFFL